MKRSKKNIFAPSRVVFAHYALHQLRHCAAHHFSGIPNPASKNALRRKIPNQILPARDAQEEQSRPKPSRFREDERDYHRPTGFGGVSALGRGGSHQARRPGQNKGTVGNRHAAADRAADAAALRASADAGPAGPRDSAPGGSVEANATPLGSNFEAHHRPHVLPLRAYRRHRRALNGVAPKWGRKIPYAAYLAKVTLLADHTWEVEPAASAEA